MKEEFVKLLKDCSLNTFLVFRCTIILYVVGTHHMKVGKNFTLYEPFERGVCKQSHVLCRQECEEAISLV